MAPTSDTTSRTAHLLTLMKNGDDAFNARDFATVDEVHHPDIIVISAFWDAAVQRQQLGLASRIGLA